jgi:hypothetical protein
VPQTVCLILKPVSSPRSSSDSQPSGPLTRDPKEVRLHGLSFPLSPVEAHQCPRHVRGEPIAGDDHRERFRSIGPSARLPDRGRAKILLSRSRGGGICMSFTGFNTSSECRNCSFGLGESSISVSLLDSEPFSKRFSLAMPKKRLPSVLATEF